MPGLVPGIHVFEACSNHDVDGRDKPGHDEIRGHGVKSCGRRNVHAQSVAYLLRLRHDPDIGFW
jgi:hypothetical protein